MPARFASARRAAQATAQKEPPAPGLHVVSRTSPIAARQEPPHGWFQADLAEFGRRAAEGSADSVCIEVVALAERWLPGMPVASMLLADDARAFALRASSAWDPAFRCLPPLTDPADASFGGEIVAGAVVRARELNPGQFGFDRLLDESGIRGVLAVPLVASRVTRGLLLVGWRHGFGPSDAQVDLLRQVGFQAGASLEILKLQGQLDSAHAALQDAQGRLLRTQRLRSLGELSSGVAHQFNNALTTILGMTEWLLMREPGDSSMRRDLGAIKEAAEKAAGISQRLEMLSRHSSDGGSVQLVDLSGVVRSVPILARPDSPGRPPVEIVATVKDVPPVEGIEGEMAEVVMSLVANAIESMPRGGTIGLTLDCDGRDVTLQVRDDGTGMSDEVLGRAFEPFFSTKGSAAPGLGLTLSRSIAERRGGSLTCESALGSGTTVTLTLPVAGTRQTPVSLLTRPPLTSGESPDAAERSLKILLVDDEPEVRKSLGDLLRALGHDVVTVEGPEAALAACAREVPDLVVTDFGMPRMDGGLLAKALRRDHAALPIVLLTGWGAEIDSIEADGFSAVVGKPVTLKSLRAALRPWVEAGDRGDSLKRGVFSPIP
jgi:signal transduction histidine kinase/ActR/RegA family two-component response regulator